MRISLVAFLALALVIACNGGNNGQKNTAQAQSAPLGNNNGVCNAGNGNGNVVQGAPCSSTPTPAPATPPPLRDQMSWFGEEAAEGVYSNHSATAAQVAQYLDFCIGYENTTTVIFPTTCPASGRGGFANGWIYYIESGMGQPNTSGHDVDIPWGSYTNASGKTCNAAAKTGSGNFWNQQTTVTLAGNSYTLPDYTSTGSNNWFIYANGGTTGDVHYMGSGWTGSIYYFYLNMNSTSLLAYMNDVFANCAYNSTYASNSASFDAGNIFNDNVYIGFQSKTWDKWDRYVAGKNFGQTASGTYGDPTYGASGNSFVPASFFNAASHTRTSAITSNDTPITYAADTSYRSAQTSLLGALKHANGSAMLVTYNGFLNTDQTANMNTNTRFPIAEEVLVGCFGACGTPQPLPYNGPVKAQVKSALGTDLGPKTAINNLAALYQEVVKPGINTNVGGMFLADAFPYIEGSTTTTSLGTGIHQQEQLWQYAPLMLMFTDDAPGLTAEFSNMCGNSSNTAVTGANCMDVWPLDFVMPSGRITAMPADPAGASNAQPCGEYSGYQYEGTGVQCSTGGAYDSNIRCNGTAGLYCAEFNHLWAFKVTGSAPCTAYDRRQWAACATDIGPAAVMINASGASTTVNAANLALWFPHVSLQLAHLLVPCTPTASYWGSTAGSPVYAMPQSGTLGYGTASVCSGNTGKNVPDGGTWDNSKNVTDLTTNAQLLYDGQAIIFTH